jgi:hypothetical protein
VLEKKQERAVDEMAGAAFITGNRNFLHVKSRQKMLLMKMGWK